jgi:CubicO group peptidase (beta-lactamase class C family)
MEAAKDRFRTVRDFFPLFVDKPLEFEPGSRFRYSNAGFMILGAVIEEVSGQSY